MIEEVGERTLSNIIDAASCHAPSAIPPLIFSIAPAMHLAYFTRRA